MPTIREHLLAATRQLEGNEAVAEARLLLIHASDRSRGWLFAHADDEVDDALAARFDALIAQRRAGVPIAYLTGEQGFWSLLLRVTPDVLIPRPETERLVELALDRLPREASLRVADLGTGSGAIALAIASERPQASVIGCDASEVALAVARTNAERLGLERVEFAHGDWWSALGDRCFDIVVSNPPYIADGDEHLSRGDLRFEPMTALASAGDGLADIERIIDGAPAHLADGGWLLLEHGWRQGAPVRDRLSAAGFVDVETWRDLEDRDRVSGGRVRRWIPSIDDRFIRSPVASSRQPLPTLRRARIASNSAKRARIDASMPSASRPDSASSSSRLACSR